jgi:DNA-binding beta-propeller fold protein YncE
MALRHVTSIALPAHAKDGGFDHAAVHGSRGLLYVAHTANDAIDIVDCVAHRYVGSIAGLTAVAGALVSEGDDLVFTSNRGENTVGIFTPGDDEVTKVRVGIRPNGLAYDKGRRLLLAANVGNPDVVGSFTVSIVDVARKKLVADVPVPGRTRWTVFDPTSGLFYVNVLDPPVVVAIDATKAEVARTFPSPVAGPHGLAIDVPNRHLFCACDGGQLLRVSVDSGQIVNTAELSGVPDVAFWNERRRQVYVAVGDPGVIDVFDADSLRRLASVKTESGTHTIGFDAVRQTVYAFMPESHCAAVYAIAD